MVRLRGNAGVQGPPLRPAVPPDRPVHSDLTDLLPVRSERRPQATPRPRLAVRGMRSVAGPGHQRGGQRRQGRRAGGDSLPSAGKTGTRPGAARNPGQGGSRNPPEVTPGSGMTGGNLHPSGAERKSIVVMSWRIRIALSLDRQLVLVVLAPDLGLRLLIDVALGDIRLR